MQYECLVCHKECKSIKSLLLHVNKAHNYTTEQYYNLNHTRPRCNCGKFTSFIDYTLGYRQYCSAKCAANADKTKQKRIQTCRRKYECDNISQLDSTKSKKVATYMLHIDQTKEKVKQTNQQKYGCDWITQSDIFKNKAKQTCIEKYGVDNYAKSDQWLEQLKNKYQQDKELYTKLGYIPTQELLLKYGSGWYQHKLVPMVKYKHKSYVEGKYLDQIKQYSKRTKSKLESYIYKKLNCACIIQNSRKIIAPYELDIYLPLHRLAIEVNGTYRHSIENGTSKNYHLMKSIMCRDKDIRLIHIYEFEDIDKQIDLVNQLLLGQDNFPKNDFNKNNFLEIPKPTIIHENYTVYGAGPLIKNNY